jgi:GNAT superfamily N-acetyltransferase
VSLEVRHGAGTDPVPRELIGAMVAEVERMYDAAVDPLAEQFAPPDGAYVTLWRRGDVVAGGGLRRLPDGACEIKRMYVVPASRGGGTGRALLEALEAHARGLGFAVVRLDTGAKQERAQRMYERAGYRPVADYNGNPLAAYWGEKRLDQT